MSALSTSLTVWPTSILFRGGKSVSYLFQLALRGGGGAAFEGLAAPGAGAGPEAATAAVANEEEGAETTAVAAAEAAAVSVDVGGAGVAAVEPGVPDGPGAGRFPPSHELAAALRTLS